MRARHSLTLIMRLGVAGLALAAGFGAAMPAWAEPDQPFAISVDGRKLNDGGALTADGQSVDATVAGVDIKVKFDGLGVKPMLNVSTYPMQVNFRSGDAVRFLASTNYEAWIDHSEIRIIDDNSGLGAPPFAVIPVTPEGAAEWRMPENAPAHMSYALRVYDAKGRYDETRPLPIKHSSSNLPLDGAETEAVAPGYSEDRTAFRNISVYGGSLTVSGKHVPKDHLVTVMGAPAPVDNEGGFVVQRILPPGHHAVDVTVLQDGKGLNYSRDMEIPEDEWFGVGLADLTVGHNFGNGIVEHTSVDEFPGTWTQGRAAMYLKGKIRGQYILTASADTGTGSIQEMFSGIAGKDPNAMLKRISPNDYYPVYGDDSSSVNDAPTSGKFYVRLERGPSSVMWGNFKSNITGTKFMESTRALYGASGIYKSEQVTKDGEAQRAASVYAAQPSTVPQTDVFRGTGGSAYFLQHQDITAGSDIISIEVRNAITGFVIARTQLNPSTDYRLDPVNGVLILNAPLSADTPEGYEQFLVAHYSFEPVASDGNAYAFGGRAESWLGDHVRVGVSGLREKQQTADQSIYGADVRVQSSKNTFVEGEVAHSEGPGFGQAYSVDGGLSLQNTPSAGITGVPADAWRVEGAASLDEVTKGKVHGGVEGRYEHYAAGFSSPQTQATGETVKWGAGAEARIAGEVKGKGTFSETRVQGQSLMRQGDARVAVPVAKDVTIEPYARYTEQSGTVVAATQDGGRGDAGAKLIYKWDKDHEAYVFGQGTVALSGTMLADNRGGVGGKTKLTDRISATGEVSNGTQGVDVTGAIDYAPTADDHYNLGYRRDVFRSSSPGYPYLLSGADLGTITLGGRHKFNEEWSAYSENNFDFFGYRHSLTDTYGVVYTPAPAWKIDGAVAVGRVFDETINPTTGLKNSNLYREAASGAVIYHEKDYLDGKVKVEVRHDYADDGSSEIMAYLLQAGIGAKMSPDWRALANLDAVRSTASDTTKDSTYINGIIGAAYRPELSDTVNALFKYNFIYDNPGAGQVTLDGTTSSPAQMSHILSADVTYQLTQKFAVGGKYGFRIGEIRDRAAGADWTTSQAHLGILRIDFHLVNEWDAMAEGRALWSPTTGTTDYGFVAAIYRELGDNFKVGIGYNFGDFSDDVSHIAHDNHGVFLNVIGKF